MDRLEPAIAARMAALAADNIEREYPNAPGHLLRSAEDLVPPRALHPAFYGSYDWHSSVHQHWLLVRLLRTGAVRDGDAERARAALARTLTARGLELEAAYLAGRPAFERTYGWAWALALAAELSAWNDADAARWSTWIAPMVAAVRANWLAFLERTTYPIRAGTHGNSAFGLALGLDYARAAGDDGLTRAFEDRARTWFAADADYPAHLEPGGDDFLSPALVEARLMTAVLGPAFDGWLRRFLPGVGSATPGTLFSPAEVADRSDPKTVHLDGLNLARAWCWRAVAANAGDAAVAEVASEAATAHLDAALPHLFGGDYVAEHWTSTFALLALSEPVEA
jgi:hypothetical protein